MNAIEFVKKFGFIEARSVLLKSKYHYEVDVYLVDTKEFTYIAIQPSENDAFVSLTDLKQIVDAFKLVERYGGVEEANKLNYDEFRSDINWNSLQQAINLVEQCQ